MSLEFSVRDFIGGISNIQIKPGLKRRITSTQDRQVRNATGSTGFPGVKVQTLPM